MDKFLEMYNLTRLNQDKIEKMNRQITRTEIESVIKKLPTNKSPGQDGFTGEFYQTFREELTPILRKLFQKFQRRDTPKLILSGHYHPDTTTRQRHQKKRQLHANFTDEHQCKHPQQNTSKLNPTIY